MSADHSNAVRERRVVNSEAAPAQAIHADLPATLRAPRQARQTVRRVLSSWGLGNLSGEAELLASELVANAAEHGDGAPIGLTIRQHAEPGGQRGILCEVTDSAPDLPSARPAEPDSERGRGLHVVAAIATSSGFSRSPHGKTAWFTLTTQRERCRSRQADLGAKAGA